MELNSNARLSNPRSWVLNFQQCWKFWLCSLFVVEFRIITFHDLLEGKEQYILFVHIIALPIFLQWVCPLYMGAVNIRLQPHSYIDWQKHSHFQIQIICLLSSCLISDCSASHTQSIYMISALSNMLCTFLFPENSYYFCPSLLHGNWTYTC